MGDVVPFGMEYTQGGGSGALQMLEQGRAWTDAWVMFPHDPLLNEYLGTTAAVSCAGRQS
jgi:hypothetical protein